MNSYCNKFKAAVKIIFYKITFLKNNIDYYDHLQNMSLLHEQSKTKSFNSRKQRKNREDWVKCKKRGFSLGGEEKELREAAPALPLLCAAVRRRLSGGGEKKTKKMKGRRGCGSFGRKEGEEGVLVEGAAVASLGGRQAYKDGGRSRVRRRKKNEKSKGRGCAPSGFEEGRRKGAFG